MCEQLVTHAAHFKFQSLICQLRLKLFLICFRSQTSFAQVSQPKSSFVASSYDQKSVNSTPQQRPTPKSSLNYSSERTPFQQTITPSNHQVPPTSNHQAPTTSNHQAPTRTLTNVNDVESNSTRKTSSPTSEISLLSTDDPDNLLEEQDSTLVEETFPANMTVQSFLSLTEYFRRYPKSNFTSSIVTPNSHNQNQTNQAGTLADQNHVPVSSIERVRGHSTKDLNSKSLRSNSYDSKEIFQSLESVKSDDFDSRLHPKKYDNYDRMTSKSPNLSKDSFPTVSSISQNMSPLGYSPSRNMGVIGHVNPVTNSQDTSLKNGNVAPDFVHNRDHPICRKSSEMAPPFQVDPEIIDSPPQGQVYKGTQLDTSLSTIKDAESVSSAVTWSSMSSFNDEMFQEGLQKLDDHIAQLQASLKKSG